MLGRQACVITAGCHMFAHSSGSLRLVADAAFCVFVKREKKKLQEVVFCKLRKFLGFIEKHSYKRSRRGLWEERWQWGVWGGYLLLLTALRGSIPEAVILGLCRLAEHQPFSCVSLVTHCMCDPLAYWLSFLVLTGLCSGILSTRVPPAAWCSGCLGWCDGCMIPILSKTRFHCVAWLSWNKELTV